MLILKTRMFQQWAKSQKLEDSKLIDAVNEMNLGLIDADLGSGLYKKRVAKPGFGKRSGYRTLVAFRSERRAIFCFGFAKNEKENISDSQLRMLKKLAKDYLHLPINQIERLIDRTRLCEVNRYEI